MPVKQKCSGPAATPACGSIPINADLKRSVARTVPRCHWKNTSNQTIDFGCRDASWRDRPDPVPDDCDTGGGAMAENPRLLG